MASFQQHTVAYYLTGFQGRNLATLPQHNLKTDLIKYIEKNGGDADGDWYKFDHESDLKKAIVKTRELGGHVYDLPEKGPV